MKIREASAGDVPALSRLAACVYADAFGHSFTPSDLAAHVDRHLGAAAFATVVERDTVLLADERGALAGFVQAGAGTVPVEGATGEAVEIRRLYVDTARQGRGIGSALLEAVLGHPCLAGAAHVFLDVWEHNEGALRLYRRHGFEVCGKRRFEVASGGPTSFDLIMIRPPPPAVGGTGAARRRLP